MLIPSRAFGFIRSGCNGRFGVRVPEFGTGGDYDNILANDVEVGDEAAGVEFCPVVPAQFASGLLKVYTDGSLSFTGAADGTYDQSYECWIFTPGSSAPVKRLFGSGPGADPVLSITVGSATSAVQSDISIAWNILNSVARDQSLNWNVINAVSGDHALSWNILNSVARDQSLNWDVLNAVSADTSFTWSILGSVQRDIALLWDIENEVTPGTARSDLAISWNVLNATQRDLPLLWSVAQAVSSDFPMTWGVLNSVQRDFTATWSIIGRTQRDLSIAWSIEGDGVAPVTRVTVTIEPFYSVNLTLTR